MLHLNRYMSRQNIIDDNELEEAEIRFVFSQLNPLFGSGDDAKYLEEDADEVIGMIRRPPKSDQSSFYDEQKENPMIAVNQEMKPFERIALGIERLIEVLVPKEATSSPAVERLSPLAAAKQMRLNEQTVMKWCREGRLVASKVGGQWIIPQESVDAYIRKCEVIHGRRGGK